MQMITADISMFPKFYSYVKNDISKLTHWADAKDGVDYPVPGDPLNEEGNAFELEIYGKIIVL